MAEKYVNIQHGKYVTELTAAYSVFKELKAPQIGALGNIDFGGADFTIGYSFIDKPFLMIREPMKHDFGQVLIWLGRDHSCVSEFDSETEFTIEDEVYHITYPCVIYLPNLVKHGPLNITRVTKPFLFFDIVLYPEPSNPKNHVPVD
jgi:hypothetical protein